MPALFAVYAVMVTVPVNVSVCVPSPGPRKILCSTPLPVPWISSASTATHAGQSVACGLGRATSGAAVAFGVLKMSGLVAVGESGHPAG